MANTTAAPRPAPSAPNATPVSASDATALVGTYYSDDLDATWKVIRLDDGRLALQLPRRLATPMAMTAPNTFRAGGTTVRFERGGDAPATAIVVTVPRIGDMRLVRR